MNSNLDRYLQVVIDSNALALEEGATSLAESIPCIVCRELEAPLNPFVHSSDPFVTSYRALSRNQHVLQPPIPRKIEFESAVYLKEGVLDRIFPNADVTILFVGDGTSDKRFSYNCHRLFDTFDGRFRIYSFLCNEALIGQAFGPKAPATPGWDSPDEDRRLFYHATDWAELTHFLELAEAQRPDRQVLVVIDIDGTYLCPRPAYNHRITEAREEAIISFSRGFAPTVFNPSSPDDVTRLRAACHDAAATVFSKIYDDADLTMLLALGLYSGIIDQKDPLLNPDGAVGFTVPIEWLQYASFLIDNQSSWEYSLRQLRSLYTRCADAIKDGSPTAFAEFREVEESILRARAETGEIVLNRYITTFVRECATRGCVPICFSDRPNASLGLKSTSTPACTATPNPKALLTTSLRLTA